MKNINKCLLTAVILIVIGCVTFVIALAAAGWDIGKIGVNNTDMEKHVYTPGEEFTEISVALSSEDLKFALAEDGVCRVETYTHKKAVPTVEIVGGKLQVSVADNRSWNEHVVFFSCGNVGASVTVYLPQKAYDSMQVTIGSGNTEIASCGRFGRITVGGASGNILCRDAEAETLTLGTASGNIEVRNLSFSAAELSTASGNILFKSSAVTDAHVTAHTASGRIQLKDMACGGLNLETASGEVALEGVTASGAAHITTTSGAVRFRSSDAASIKVKTTSGDVSGTLLSDKIFATHTQSGWVDTPASASGGLCEIETISGSVRISVQK